MVGVCRRYGCRSFRRFPGAVGSCRRNECGSFRRLRVRIDHGNSYILWEFVEII